jgi:hypothetical protein
MIVVGVIFIWANSKSPGKKHVGDGAERIGDLTHS